MKISSTFNNKQDLLYFSPVFLALLAGYPYVFSRFLQLPSIVIIIGLLCCYLFIQYSRTNKKVSLHKSLKICILVQCLVWAVYSILHTDTSYVTRIVFIFTTYLLLLTLKNSGKEKKFSYYNTFWIAIQAILAMVAFVLCLIGILHPLFEFQNVDTRVAYFFGISSTNTLYGNLSRMAGYFDEPGALATWGVFALVYNKLFFGNKKIEYALIIGLFSTLSLAYFTLLALYLLFFYSRHFLKLLPLVLIVYGFFHYIMVHESDNAKLYELTIERIEQAEQGDYGRNEMADRARKYFYQSPIFGNGAKYVEEVDYLGDNHLESFAKDGIVGTIVLYLPLLVVMYKTRKKREVLWGCLILAACYFQRPFHINFMHYVMLYSFCSLALSSNELSMELKR